jgi:transcriptional regulator with XRE-family HTH domain
MAETMTMNPTAASALSRRGTASDLVVAPSLSQTRLVAARLTEDVGWTRGEARILHEKADDLHQRSHDVEWRIATAERAKDSPATLLNDLADLGFAWRDIARMVHVSVPAVQKWRRGERASGESRQRLAGLAAACDLIASHYMVDEVASWFDVPLVASVPLTPISLYAADRADLVFDFASGHFDPGAILVQFDSSWRERYRSDYEVFEASDGNKSIRSKD